MLMLVCACAHRAFVYVLFLLLQSIIVIKVARNYHFIKQLLMRAISFITLETRREMQDWLLRLKRHPHPAHPQPLPWSVKHQDNINCCSEVERVGGRVKCMYHIHWFLLLVSHVVHTNCAL